MTAPTWATLRGAIEKMVAYPAGDGWHISREAADKALEWIKWAEVHQPYPVPKLLSEEDEDLSLVWRSIDGWAIYRTFPKGEEPYWLAMPSRTPEALAASPEVQALIAAAETRGWNAAIEAAAKLLGKYVDGLIALHERVDRLTEAAIAAAQELRVIAGMDLIGASAVTYNAVRPLEAALKETTHD